MFSFFDYSIMVLYVLGLIILGIYLKGKASASLEDYFLGGNKLPWWALGISGMASHLSLTGTMIIVSLLFLFGSRGLYIGVRGSLGLIMAFAMVYMGKWNRRSNCMTVAEWMEYRFGKGVGGESARLINAFAVLLCTVGMLAVLFKGWGLFLSIFFPFSPAVCALVMIVIALVYTVMSGFYGVVFTDLFQSIFIVATVIVVSILAYGKISDTASFSQIAADVSANTDWMKTTIPLSAQMPEGYQTFEKFAFAIFFYFLITVLMGMSKSAGRSMYFGARSERECGTLTFVWLISSAIRWPLVISFAVLGIFLVKQLFPDTQAVMHAATLIKQHCPTALEHNWGELIHSIVSVPQNFSADLIDGLRTSLGQDWQSRLRMIGFHGSVNSEQILPAVVLYVVPLGFRGLMFVSLLAAAMSTFDTCVNMSAAYFVKDIYQRFIRPKAEIKELLRISHITCIVIVATGFIMGYFTKSINEIWAWFMIGIGGGMVLPGVLRWYWWRFNGIGYAVGTFAGLVAAIVQRYYLPGLPVWWQFPFVMGASLIGVLIGTYLSKPTDKDVLRNFYRTTKPFGFWKLFKNELDPQSRKAVNDEHRNDIISLFFAVPWQFLLYWTPVQFMIHAYRNFVVSLILLIFCSIGLYFFWYKNLPDASQQVNTVPIIDSSIKTKENEKEDVV